MSGSYDDWMDPAPSWEAGGRGEEPWSVSPGGDLPSEVFESLRRRTEELERMLPPAFVQEVREAAVMGLAAREPLEVPHLEKAASILEFAVVPADAPKDERVSPLVRLDHLRELGLRCEQSLPCEAPDEEPEDFVEDPHTVWADDPSVRVGQDGLAWQADASGDGWHFVEARGSHERLPFEPSELPYRDPWEEWEEALADNEPDLLHYHGCLRARVFAACEAYSRQLAFAETVRLRAGDFLDAGCTEEHALVMAEAVLRAEEALSQPQTHFRRDFSAEILALAKGVERTLSDRVWPVVRQSGVVTRLAERITLGRLASHLVALALALEPAQQVTLEEHFDPTERWLAGALSDAARARVEVPRGALTKAGDALGGSTRVLWLGLSAAFVARHLRNGYAHRHHAQRGVLEAGLDLLVGPEALFRFLHDLSCARPAAAAVLLEEQPFAAEALPEPRPQDVTFCVPLPLLRGHGTTACFDGRELTWAPTPEGPWMPVEVRMASGSGFEAGRFHLARPVETVWLRLGSGARSVLVEDVHSERITAELEHALGRGRRRGSHEEGWGSTAAGAADHPAPSDPGDDVPF